MIPRYTLPEMAAVWSDQARSSHWLRIEVLACEAWARQGLIPSDDLEAIRARASFSVDRVEELERVTSHDVAAFVQNVAETVGPARSSIVSSSTASGPLSLAQRTRLIDEAPVGHRHRFRETFRFVVHRPWSDRVDITPIGFLLRVLERISVTLRGR